MKAVQLSIISSLRRIGRAMTVEELMPMCLPHCAHVVDCSTGSITYDRDNFCCHMQDLMKSKQIVQNVDQLRGQITYSLPVG